MRSSAARRSASSALCATPMSAAAISRIASRPFAMPKSSTSAVWQAKPSHERNAAHFAQEARLAHAGVAAHVDGAAPASGTAAPERGRELREFGLAPDERLPVVQRRPRQIVAEPEDAQRCVDAFRTGAMNRVAAHDTVHRGMHALVEHRFAGTREPDQAGREIHGLADHGVGAVLRTAETAGDDFARRNADVHRERPAQLRGKRRHCALDLGGRSHRACGVVTVRDRRAEHGHDCIADVLVDAAATANHDPVERLEIAAEQGVQVLGVELLRQPCVAA